MKLYGSQTSPYVRKVRIVLKEKDLPCEFIAVGANDPGSPVPCLNPLGKVPVLVRDDGESVFDSLVIVEYLDALKNASLFPATGDARWQVLRWQALGQGMLDATVSRLMETRRPADKQVASAITHQEGKIAAALQYAETNLGKGQHLVGNRLTMADIALGVAFEYLDFRYTSEWRRQHPRLNDWLAGLSARLSFRETQPPGTDGSKK